MTEQEFKWQAKNPADFSKFKKALYTLTEDFKKTASKVLIVDSYFDDEKKTMSSKKAALRLRSVDGSYEITFKTASHITEGFVKRTEETIPLFGKSHTKAMAQFKGVVHKQWPEMGRPAAIFMIKNKRQTLLIESRVFSAEVCFDDCNILVNDKNIKMYEIEMELKKGDVKEFTELAGQITELTGLNYAQVSKVATAFKSL